MKRRTWTGVGVILVVAVGLTAVTHPVVRDELRWRWAAHQDELVAYRAYLRAWPEGRHAREAGARSRPRDVFDLLRQGVVELQTSSTGMGYFDARFWLRRRGDRKLTARIPAGTYLTAVRGDGPSMITTRPGTVYLATADRRYGVGVPASATELHAGVADAFAIGVSPPDEELAQLLPALSGNRIADEVRQAAVWIVSPGANYREMGIIKRIPGLTRVIREHHVAAAMQLCDRAGIDVTRKRIWRDRDMILVGLEDEPAAAWLREKGRDH